MAFYKKSKTLILLVATVLSGFLSYKLVYFLGEKYFFDKLFYRKSVKHGYENTWKLENDNDRAKDLIALKSFIKNNTQENNQIKKVLGVKDNNIYTIAIIGDSYVWGTGIKEHERFSRLLEKKLNKIKNSYILSLGLPGDNLYEHYVKYQILEEAKADIDLYIFTITQSDIFLNKDGKKKNLSYENKTLNDIFNNCNNENGLYIYDYNILKESMSGITYLDMQKKAWNTTANFCFAEKVFNLLPKDNSIYFLATNYSENCGYNEFIDIFNKNNVRFLSPYQKNVPKKYRKYYKKSWMGLAKYFTVSPHEKHPSALANKMYADFLFEEITNNPKYKFNQNN